MNANNKHCVLMVVDALTQSVVREHLQDGRLPNLKRLVDEGGRLNQCLSIFPSITPAATCSIVTGSYPIGHGIEGACWFDRELCEIAYFGDDLKFALERGFHDYLLDFGDRLNFERLSKPTIFRTLHDAGIDSACINYMWFAGPHTHERTTPLLLRATVGKLPPTVQGPKYLKLGDFVDALPEGVGERPGRGIFAKYGFSDEVTANCLMLMAEANALPPLTLAYFPDNDFESHEEGPEAAADGVLVRFDHFLGEFVRLLGGWQRLGDDVEILIVGDHSQTEFLTEHPDTVALDECLGDFSLASIGHPWQEGDQMFVCPNMRAAAVYLRDPDDHSLQDQVVNTLLGETRIDQVMYETSTGERRVETSDRGSMSFRRCDGGNGDGILDGYGNRWTVEGDLATVDAHLAADGTLQEGLYPNPLERIDGAFVKGSRPIWITAGSNTEFRIRETSTHDGGSHGSLHRDDSDSALFTTAGVPLRTLPDPDRPRIVDVVALCLRSMGIEPGPAAADSAASPRCSTT